MPARSLRIQYRATPDEAKGIQRLARREGLSMADVLRRLVRNAINGGKHGKAHVRSSQARKEG
jgi:Ribbon-helix-helix protein, copG family